MGAVTQAKNDQVARQEEGDTLRQAIKRSEQQFALALPSHVDTGRFVRSALTALNTVPKLAECTQMSVLRCLMQSAQLGLEVADVRGQAFLIPRKNRRDNVMEATFQLGFRGLIDLAGRAGITIDVDKIHENDPYESHRGTDPKLIHRPGLSNRGEVIAYYAVAHFADDRRPSFAIMGREEVEIHRDKFASSRDYKTKAITGPWVDHFDAMAIKTVIRKLLNYQSMSVELRQQVIDVEANEPSDIGPIDYTPAPPPNVDAGTGEINADPIAAIDATASDS